MIKHVCDPNGGGAEALPLDDPRAGGGGGRGSSPPPGPGCGSPAGHGHGAEGTVVLERQDYSFITNGDRLRAMSDEELVDWLRSPAEEGTT